VRNRVTFLVYAGAAIACGIIGAIYGAHRARQKQEYMQASLRMRLDQALEKAEKEHADAEELRSQMNMWLGERL